MQRASSHNSPGLLPISLTNDTKSVRQSRITSHSKPINLVTIPFVPIYEENVVAEAVEENFLV